MLPPFIAMLPLSCAHFKDVIKGWSASGPHGTDHLHIFSKATDLP